MSADNTNATAVGGSALSEGLGPNAQEFAWLVEEFTREGQSTGRYMRCQVDKTITADPAAARRFRHRRTAEFCAEEMPRDLLAQTVWRATEHGFGA